MLPRGLRPLDTDKTYRALPIGTLKLAFLHNVQLHATGDTYPAFIGRHNATSSRKTETPEMKSRVRDVGTEDATAGRKVSHKVTNWSVRQASSASSGGSLRDSPPGPSSQRSELRN